MEQTGLKAFEDALRADEGMRRRYEEALKDITEAASDGEAMQRAAAQLGFEVSLEELEQAWASAQELDVSELESVAGGQIVHDNICLAVWYCFTAALHTEVETIEPQENRLCRYDFDYRNHTEACWKDYNCLVWNN